MKLDRNINNNGRGKYALLRLREWPHGYSPECQHAFDLLNKAGAIDFGNSDETDFFLIRLKDRFSGPALRAYATAISAHITQLDVDDPQRIELVEYHHDIIRLAESAHSNPNQRTPD